MATPKRTWRQRVVDSVSNALLISLIRLACVLPYETRLRLSGRVMVHVLAPLAGYRRRVRRNLAYIWPNLSQAETDRLCHGSLDNIGRAVIELYSGEEFIAHNRDNALQGPGVAALDRALATGRPIVAVSGHFGNYEAARVALRMRGHRIGALYREMNNAAFNAHYVKALSAIASPVFRRDRRGLGQMVQFLRQGNTIALLTDQYHSKGQRITFLGQETRTTTSAADLALKYDALLIPIYGIRRADGVHFDVVAEPPIPHSTVATMTQEMTDSLAAQIARHPEQWLWVHDRWKLPRV